MAGGATCCGSTAATDQATTATDQPATVRHDEAHRLPVVVIGAGPIGLAAAAHLHERGLPFTVLEAGPGPGASVAAWGHVRLFSPWRYNIDALVPLPPEGLSGVTQSRGAGKPRHLRTVPNGLLALPG